MFYFGKNINNSITVFLQNLCSLNVKINLSEMNVYSLQIT